MTDNRLTFEKWKQNVSSETSWLLDLRNIRSCTHSQVVSIPMAGLRERSFELPPRHISFAVITDSSSDLQDARNFLAGTLGSRQKPWNVTAWILVPQNIPKCLYCSCDWPKSERLPRLWQPDTMIDQLLLPLLSRESLSDKEIWDLGAGSGRDVCFLAEELHMVKQQPDFRVVALDQRYRTQEEMSTLKGFFQRRHVQDVTDCRQVQLNNVEQVMDGIHSSRVICLFAVRYWNRPLFERLAQSDQLASGTIIAISQFGKPHVGAPWNFAHPKEKHVLGRNELSELFGGQWKIHWDQVVSDSDHGRTLIQFVAQLQR